jgi:hypothetical protein
MRAKLIPALLAVLLTTVLPATSASAAKPPLQDAVNQLLTVKTGYTMSVWQEGELPATFSVQDVSRFEVGNFELTERVIGDTRYTLLDPRLKARAALAKRTSAKWYSSLGASSSDLPTIRWMLADAGIAPRFGVIIPNDKGYLVTTDYSELGWDEIVDYVYEKEQRSASEYQYTLDSRGRIVAIDGKYMIDFYGEEEWFSYNMRISYTVPKITAPVGSTVLPMAATDALPRLSAVYDAALETAYYASRRRILDRVAINVDHIYTAAAGIATPPGLTAAYLSNGLKYTVGKESWCITTNSKKTAAEVKRCK